MLAAGILVGAQGAQAGATQPTLSLILEFERVVTPAGKPEERTTGVIYFKAAGRTLIKISEPVEQVMLLETSSLTLHYPRRAEVLEFHNRSGRPFDVPVMGPILTWTTPDSTFAKLGLVKVPSGELEQWLTPAKAQLPFVRMTVARDAERRLRSTEMWDREGRLIGQVKYGKPLRSDDGSCTVPSSVRTVSGWQPDSSETEDIRITTVQCNAAFPADVDAYRVPANVKVKRVDW